MSAGRGTEALEEKQAPTGADKPQTTTAAEWGGSARKPGLGRHYVTLPSSAVVGIEIPDLPELIASGDLPNDLVDIAVKIAQGGADVSEELTRDAITKQPEFYRFVVKLTVKEPAVNDELYDRLPFEDKEMIVALATRQRDIDALYQHIGGLHTSTRWRKFRGLDDIDPALASV